MNEKTVYIAGKITGNENFQEDFANAVLKLREQGYMHIINPCCLSNLNLDYEQFMKITFAMVDTADSIYMLKNWKESEGAKREYLYATSKCKEILYEV